MAAPPQTPTVLGSVSPSPSILNSPLAKASARRKSFGDRAGADAFGDADQRDQLADCRLETRQLVPAVGPRDCRREARQESQLQDRADRRLQGCVARARLQHAIVGLDVAV